MNKALITLILTAILGAGAFAYSSWQSVTFQDKDGFAVGAYNTGTEFNVIEGFNLAFVADTSTTFSTDAGSTYYVSGAWKSSSADPGKTTVSITSGVGTVTAASATTGTYSVIVHGAP